MLDLFGFVRTYNSIYQEDYYKITAKALMKRFREYLVEYFALPKDNLKKLNIDLFNREILPFIEERDLGIIDVDQLSATLNRDIIMARLPAGVGVLKTPTRENAVGKYRIIQEIGQGAYGKVYMGRRGKTDYAIKVVPVDIKRFDAMIREIELLQQVSAIKPKVAPEFYEAFLDQDMKNLYIVMEYMNCGSLADWERDNELTSKNVADLKKMISALHKAGIYHRDLHDENILVKCDKKGKPSFYISDFGLSKNIANFEKYDYELVEELTGEGLVEATLLKYSPSAMIKELIVRDIVEGRLLRQA